VSLPHLIRPAALGDRGYILQTWLESYRASPGAQQLPDFAYWSHFGHVGLVEALLEKHGALVACLPERPSWIYGWMCAGGKSLHYAFTRFEFRKQGIGRALFEVAHKPERVTHVTIDGGRWMAAMGVRPEYVNPYREMR
jgi:GNAT superfamily N-acetyltransferase